MRWLFDVGRLIFASLPHFLLDPLLLALLVVAAVLVGMQYRRVAGVEEAMYGIALRSPLSQTWQSLIHGVLGGVLGSFLLVITGVAIPAGPHIGPVVLYLWVVAVLLSALHPRYLCFSYAAALLSLCYLAFGWPKVDVPSLCALVAVLHMVEAFLVWLSGSAGRTPVAVQNAHGEAVAGFSLQRFWPVPMMLILAAGGVPSGGGVQMPDWWPLLRFDPRVMPDPGSLVFALFPAVIVMGYADLAVTVPPEHRVNMASRNLVLYSGALFGLALLAGYVPFFMWAAALFSWLGHEAITVFAARGQFWGLPWLRQPARGVGILDVVPGSLADAAGLHPGAVILAVEDNEVQNRDELHRALLGAPAYVRILYRQGSEMASCRLPRPDSGLADFGAICVPEPGDEATVRLRSGRNPLAWLLRRLRR